MPQGGLLREERAHLDKVCHLNVVATCDKEQFISEVLQIRFLPLLNRLDFELVISLQDLVVTPLRPQWKHPLQELAIVHLSVLRFTTD